MISRPRKLAHGEEATLVEHLDELRSRLIVAGGAVLVGSIVGYAVHRPALRILIRALPPGHRHLLTLGVVEPFSTSLKLSIVIGIAIALPIVLWQVWAYFAPAFRPGATRGIGMFVALAAVLLAIGIGFGDRVALPASLKFLTNFDSGIYDTQIRASAYLSYAVLVLAACGAVFELPIVVLGLVRVGALSSARLRRNRRIGYFIVACVGVALPGVDPVTTTIETIPLAALFELSIWLSVFFEKKWHPELQPSAS